MATDLIGPLLTELLACAYEALDPKPGRSLVAPGGQVAWDDCCDGQLWTRVQYLQPAGAPTGTTNYACGPLAWDVTIGVGILRCASVVDDRGSAPRPAVLTAESMQMTQDAANLSEAVQCCLASKSSWERRLKLVRWDPLGPEGGCVGGEWSLIARVDNCRCD